MSRVNTAEKKLNSHYSRGILVVPTVQTSESRSASLCIYILCNANQSRTCTIDMYRSLGGGFGLRSAIRQGRLSMNNVIPEITSAKVFDVSTARERERERERENYASRPTKLQMYRCKYRQSRERTERNERFRAPRRKFYTCKNVHPFQR